MLAYTNKFVLELVPEALPLVKQASLEQEYPLDNRDSCIASALAVQYHANIDHKPVDPEVMTKVATAVELYGVQDEVKSMTDSMVKAARERSLQSHLQATAKDEFIVKQASFEGDLSGFTDHVTMGHRAREMYKEASNLGIEPSDEVKRYSGNGMLNKQASVESLASRYHLSRDVGYVKLASALGRMSEVQLSRPETVFDICMTVATMDKEAGLAARGFNFFKETVLTKQAVIASALKVRVANQDIPYEAIERVGKDRIAQYIGPDVANEMDGGPANAKQVFETLPLDLQRILLNLTKNV